MWFFVQNLAQFLLQVGLSHTDLFLLAILIFLIVVSFLYFAKSLAILALSLLEQQFKNGHFSVWFNVLEKVKAPIVIFNGFFYASLVLPLPFFLLQLETSLYLLVTVIFTIIVLRTIIVDFVKVYFQSKGTSPEAVKTVTNFAKVTSMIALSIIAVLIALQFSNVDAQALLGGLGIASVIVAFSFQNILRDIFAFFSIYLDRSFAVGDYVYFDKYEGTIKEIRLRTTKILGLKGHEIIISNNQLVNGVIQNYRNLKKRRVAINFRVCPALSATKSTKFVQALKDIFTLPEINQRVELTNASLYELTDHGIEFYLIYRFLYRPGDSNFAQHLAYKELILTKILALLQDHKLELMQTPYAECT